MRLLPFPCSRTPHHSDARFGWFTENRNGPAAANDIFATCVRNGFRGRRHVLARHRPDRSRQKLDCSRARPQGLPRRARSVLYHRLPRLFDALALARGDGRYARLLKSLARAELLILDDWGLAPLTPEQGRDLLEIVDDRHGRGSTIVTSQLPVDHWHEVIGNPTIADAIFDRLVHNAHQLTLKGDSMRKIAPKRSGLDASPVL